jgi:sodium transport system permease protein
MSSRELLAGAAVVLRKELKDNARDRRSLTSGLLVPLMGPLMMALLFTALARQLREDPSLVVTVRGQAHAPSLVAFLERNGLEVAEAGADAEQLVKDGKLDLLLVIPDRYGEDFAAGRAPRVELLMDRSRTKAQTPVRRVLGLLQAYAGQLGALRLLARGVDPGLATPVQVEEINLATPERSAATVLGMVPMFVLMAVFLGGLYVAIDSTAGERERGSLEPLLLNPVSRAQVVLGKWVAVVLFSWVAVVMSLLAFAVALRFVPLQDLGVRAELGPRPVALMLLVALPLTLFSGGLQMLLALFSRTFKEAQTYLSLLLFIPLLPGMMMSISPVEHQPWMMAVPSLAQTVLFGDILRGETVPTAWFALAAASSLVASAAAVAGAVWLIGQEKIVFGRGSGTS